MLLIFSYVVNYLEGRFQKMIQIVRTWIKNYFVTHNRTAFAPLDLARSGGWKRVRGRLKGSLPLNALLP